MHRITTLLLFILLFINQTLQVQAVAEEKFEIILYKTNMIPLAIYKDIKPYSNYYLPLFPDEQVYLMSDGFSNQLSR